MFRRKQDWLQRASGLLVPRTGFAYEPWRFQPCENCCLPSCVHCQGGLAPNGMQAVIDGILDDGCGADCSGYFNDTFILEPFFMQFGNCHWRYAIQPFKCNMGSVDAFARKVGSDYQIVVNITDEALYYCTFLKNYGGTRPDCLNFADEGIPFSSDASWAGDCDAHTTPATCLLTAI